MHFILIGMIACLTLCHCVKNNNEKSAFIQKELGNTVIKVENKYNTLVIPNIAKNYTTEKIENANK